MWTKDELKTAAEFGKITLLEKDIPKLIDLIEKGDWDNTVEQLSIMIYSVVGIANAIEFAGDDDHGLVAEAKKELEKRKKDGNPIQS